MSIKPKKHPKIIVKLNGDPTTDILSVEFRLDKGLRDAIETICAKEREKCQCKVCQRNSWEHFLVNTFCFAIEDALEAYMNDELQKKFKGNTTIISTSVH